MPNVVANCAYKNTLVSASYWSLSNAAILFFPGTPLCNLMEKCFALNCCIYLPAFNRTDVSWICWPIFSEKSYEIHLILLLARTFLNWDGVFWSCLVGFNISLDPAHFFLSIRLTDNWPSWSVTKKDILWVIAVTLFRR